MSVASALPGLRRFEALLARRAPLLDTAAPPLSGGQGLLPFHPPSGRIVGEQEPAPSSPEGSASTPWWQLDPARVEPGVRSYHRHGWLARLAWQAAAGVPGAREAALAGLATWLAEDRPGRGHGWVHTTDPVARLIHWLAILAWLGPHVAAPLRDRISGSVALHLQQLECRLAPEGSGDPRRFYQLMGLAVGALGWPALPGAAATAGRALSKLGPALGRLLDGDGAPRGGDLGSLPELLCHGLVLVASSQRNAAPLPRTALEALRRALCLIPALVGSDGKMPGEHDRRPEPLLPIDDRPRGASLWNAALSMGLVRGRSLPGDGGLARALGHTPLPIEEEPPLRSLRVFREAGVVVGSCLGAGAPTRILLRARASSGIPGRAPSMLTLGFSVAGVPVLTAPHPLHHPPGAPGNVAHGLPGEPPCRVRLLRARVENKVLIVGFRASGGADMAHERWVELRGSSLLVRDRFFPPRSSRARMGRALVAWQFGPACRLSWLDGAVVGRVGGHQLRLIPDPSLTWTLYQGERQPTAGWAVGAGGEPVPAPMLLGQGPLPPAGELRCRFTLA